MSDRPTVIMPSSAPYVFARQKLAKPSHIEVVTMTVRPVICHNACGVYYVAGSDAEMLPGDVCPDCNAPPKPWRIGEPEQVDHAVHMAFGNVVNLQFLRSLGKIVAHRFVNVGISVGLVKNPPG